MKKVAFEISSNIAQYNHFLPLFFHCVESRKFDVKLYSDNETNLKLLRDYVLEHFGKYSHFIDMVDFVALPPNRKSKLKYLVINYFPKFLLPLVRRIYGASSYGNTRSQTESFNDFYSNNMNFFSNFDVVMTTELKGGVVLEQYGVKLVWLLHGVISNHYPYSKDWTADLIVSPKLNFRNELLTHTNANENISVYDKIYLKKNSLDLLDKKIKSDLFKNSNPTVIYNPHWDNRDGLSSYFVFFNQVIKFFVENNNYNLIFAPHVNLDKFFDINIPQSFYEFDNIHIDTNSDRLTNGFYLQCADLYLGDVSSQYFEMLLFNEVPAVFLVDSNIDSSLYPTYWKYGRVLNTMSDFVEDVFLNNPSTKAKVMHFSQMDDNIDNLIHAIEEL